jgi:nicotinate-nucleotide adenylyltransferase
MKIGLMGGTFDPIHLGHLLAAERALEETGLDEVWFMPTNVSPHKQHAPMASAEQRWEMVVLASAAHPQFRAIDDELRRGGVSYTIDTMKEMTQKHPNDSFYFIIGADMVQYLPQWYRIEELCRLVSFIGLHRPGWELDTEQLPDFVKSAVMTAPMPMIDISSTEIRERRQQGKSIRFLVERNVYEYIEENELYGS